MYTKLAMRKRARLLALVAILTMVVGVLPSAPPVVQAATFVVDSFADDTDWNPGDGSCDTNGDGGPCTLRAAIMEAVALPGPDVITLPAGTYTLTINDSGSGYDFNEAGDLEVGGEDLTINGAGMSATIITGGPAFNDRIFDVFGGKQGQPITITFNDLTITGGNPDAAIFSGGANFAGGGGMFIGANVIFNNVALTGNEARANTASLPSGGYSEGGGIHICGSCGGSLTANNSVIDSNTTYDGSGGGIFSSGPVTLNYTSVDNNAAAPEESGCFGPNAYCNGGGILLVDGATMTITGGSVSYNAAPAGSGGMNLFGDVTLDGVAVSYNTTDDTGGGIWNGDLLTITGGTTITNNQAAFAAGIYNWAPFEGPPEMPYTTSARPNFAGWAYAPTQQPVGTLFMFDSFVQGNTAIFEAGGIANDGDAMIYDSTISGNVVSGAQEECGPAGGLDNFGTLLVDGSYIGYNDTCGPGGGLFNVGFATFTGSIIDGNTAAFCAGGVCNFNEGTFDNGVVSYNSAPGDGGGVTNCANPEFCNPNSFFHVTNSCIIGNDQYAALNWDDGAQTLNFQNNWWGAADGPGGEGPGSGDTVAGFLDYTPWATEALPQCAEPIEPPVEPEPEVVVVEPGPDLDCPDDTLVQLFYMGQPLDPGDGVFCHATEEEEAFLVQDPPAGYSYVVSPDYNGYYDIFAVDGFGFGFDPGGPIQVCFDVDAGGNAIGLYSEPPNYDEGWTVYDVYAFGSYQCADIDHVGDVALLTGGVTAPAAPAEAEAPAAPAVTCGVTTNYNVVLRAQPNEMSAELATVPFSTALTADARTADGWYRVEYAGQTGYLYGRNLSVSPDCAALAAP